MTRLFLVSGALLAALAIALGAIGSHALAPDTAKEQVAWFATAVRYHQFSSMGLLVIGALAHIGFNSRWTYFAGLSVLLGTLLFCGSLYAMAFGAARAIGSLTPFGGTLLIAGWICLALSLCLSRCRES